MKKLSLLFIGLLLIPSLFLSSCDRGDDIVGGGTSATTFSLLKDYMVANNLDADKVQVNADGLKFVVGAPADAGVALDEFLAKYYIIDIRSNADFTSKGHIEGAKNVAFTDILTEAPNSGGKPILVVCYTGQTACYATSLLRMYHPDYSDTQALKWGMSGWNAATAGPWNGKIGANEADSHTNWSYSAAPANLPFDPPTLSSFSIDGSEILKERVEQVVADGFGGAASVATVNGIDVLNTPIDYFVNNYFSEVDYAGFGHIANAYRIKENLLLSTNGNLGLNSKTKIASYCYTGQTSAVLTAWLRVLGYDAYSMLFGMNGIYNTNPVWATNQWGVGSSVPKDLPLVF